MQKSRPTGGALYICSNSLTGQGAEFIIKTEYKAGEMLWKNT